MKGKPIETNLILNNFIRKQINTKFAKVLHSLDKEKEERTVIQDSLIILYFLV